jgi:hypothetical protein
MPETTKINDTLVPDTIPAIANSFRLIYLDSYNYCII